MRARETRTTATATGRPPAALDHDGASLTSGLPGRNVPSREASKRQCCLAARRIGVRDRRMVGDKYGVGSEHTPVGWHAYSRWRT